MKKEIKTKEQKNQLNSQQMNEVRGGAKNSGHATEQ